MEDKLRAHVANQDWYSAHQMYLALAQKYQRGGRVDELAGLLMEGVETLSRAKQVNSTQDLVGHLLEIPSLPLEAASIYAPLYGMSPEHASAFGDALVKKGPQYIDVLLEACLQCDSLDSHKFYLLSSSSGDSDQMVQEMTDGDERLLLFLTRALVHRHHQKAGQALRLRIARSPGKKAIDDPSGTLPSFTAITGDACVDFCQLLYILTTKRTSSPDLYHALVDAYPQYAKAVPKDWQAALERTYWPSSSPRLSSTRATDGSPMTQMLQNLMGSFLNPPPSHPSVSSRSPSPPSSNPTRRNQNLDLD